MIAVVLAMPVPPLKNLNEALLITPFSRYTNNNKQKPQNMLIYQVQTQLKTKRFLFIKLNLMKHITAAFRG